MPLMAGGFVSEHGKARPGSPTCSYIYAHVSLSYRQRPRGCYDGDSSSYCGQEGESLRWMARGGLRKTLSHPQFLGKAPRGVFDLCPCAKRDLHVNLEVLLRFEEGEKLMQIAWALGLATSTVASVRVNKDKIHASSQAVKPVSVRQLTCCRGVVMGLTEHLLSPRIEEQKWQNPPLSMLLIQDRARRLFAQLQHEQGDG